MTHLRGLQARKRILHRSFILTRCATRLQIGLFAVAGMMLAAGCDRATVEVDSEADKALVSTIADLYLEEARFQLRTAQKEASTEAERHAETADGKKANGLSVSDVGSTLPAARRDSILRQHSMSEAIFNAAMRPYLDDPDQLQTLYDRVLDQLSEQRQQLQAQ